MKRTKMAAGNWKMNTRLDEGIQLASEVIHMALSETKDEVKIVMAVPYTHLSAIRKLIGTSKNIALAAQNCHESVSGAYTGEISAGMLKSLGVDYVIIGHSERREYFHEGYSVLAQKINAVLREGMMPIFCCGEKLEIRQAQKHFTLVEEQILQSLGHLDASDMEKIVIAYEPVWAIGTGVTASDEQAQEMHKHIRSVLLEKFGEKIAGSTPILYGGSVKPENAKGLFSCADVDGGLIGGASLSSRSFIDIAKSFS